MYSIVETIGRLGCQGAEHAEHDSVTAGCCCVYMFGNKTVGLRCDILEHCIVKEGNGQWQRKAATAARDCDIRAG